MNAGLVKQLSRSKMVEIVVEVIVEVVLELIVDTVKETVGRLRRNSKQEYGQDGNSKSLLGKDGESDGNS